MSLWLDARTQLLGLRVLARELGWRRAVSLGTQAQRRGDPFVTLPPPANDRDRLSRAQIGPAINLYLTLREPLGAADALRVVGEVVSAATMLFLDHTVGEVDVVRYRAATEADRRVYLQGFVDAFFNAEAEIVEASETRFVQKVVRCRFVELCTALEIPELARVFCVGDLAFFSQGQVRLDRPTTLSEGAASCDFQFTLREGTGSE